MKKSGFCSWCKLVIGLFLIGIFFFLSKCSVYAKMLTIDEINDRFKISFIDELNKLGSQFSSEIDTTDKVLNVYSGSEKVTSFKYTDEYIEYYSPDTNITKETIDQNLTDAIIISGMVQSLIELSGYEDKTLVSDSNVDLTNTYDTYGIQMKSKYYMFYIESTCGPRPRSQNSSQEGNNGNSYICDAEDKGHSYSGDFIEYFKMSFDTNKIDALMDKYGVDASSYDPNKEIIANLTPTLEVGEITESSITLYLHIPYINTDPDYAVYCYVYRSTSENGTYEKISDMAVNCLDDVGIVDDQLQSNTTYYYKTIVVDGTKYSNVVEVTTKNVTPTVINEPTNTNDDNTIENPQTGIFFPIFAILILMVGGILALIYTRKKSVFKRI